MNLLKSIRKSKTMKVVSVLLAISMFEQFIYPLQVYGLTGGPSQPEVQSFEPIATTQMVDPFTGDFTYNIPLFDVGGYPVNISYHSGITMDQEASYVGLGWNINPGVINRQLQGLPDDFKGDLIKYSNNLKPQVGINAAFEIAERTKDLVKTSSEFFGVPFNYTDYHQFMHTEISSFSWKYGIQYHNYRGLGYDIGYSKSLGENWPNGLGGNINLSFSSFEGYDASAGLSYGNALYTKTKDDYQTAGVLGVGLGIAWNSRSGLKDLSLTGFTSKTYSHFNTFTHKEQRQVYGIIQDVKSVTHEIDGSAALSANGGMSLVTASPSYSPTSQNSTKSASYSFSYKTGIENFGIHNYGTLSASVDWSGNEEKLKERKSLGTLYLKDYSSLENSGDYALDYNQIHNSYGRVNRFTNNIHQANQTADNFFVSGQGIAGSYKLYQGAVGTLHQPQTGNRSLPSGNFDLELGVGNIAKNGINFRYIYRDGYSGKWREEYGNKSSDNYTFGAVNGTANQEKVYFKNIGERISVDEDYLNALNAYDPTAVELVSGKCADCKNPVNGFAVSSYITDQLIHNSGNSTGAIVKGKRAERNQLMSHLTADETSNFGLTKYVSDFAEPHHIAEITIVGDDGRRYVYGQALYNTKQKEATFNVANHANNLVCKPNSTHYSPNDEATLDNEVGKEHYYSSTETPPYAHSYYITAVLSVDYVDVDNNGPSPNDLGDYVLFEYDKVLEDYKWRTPYQAYANGHFGLESNDNDNKASYVYGEKEVWYIKSMTSKHQKAEFIYDKTGRKDAFEVAGESGGIGTRTLWKLDEIKIYTEYSSPTFNSTYNPAPTAVLLKTIHFAYSYDLCKNVPNNIGTITGTNHPLIPGVDQNRFGGKLTLHKIWFTYQESQAGAESPYIFTYSDVNPDYDPEASDRWGNYKPNDCSGKYNSRFPYSSQDENVVNENASAWNLKEIELPSGGIITLEYESDDYQYVQNRNAMEMMGVHGFGKSASAYNENKISNKLYEGFAGGKERRANNFLFVNLPHPVTSNEEFREKYLRDIEELFFRVRLNVNGIFQANAGERYEYIEGFAKVSKNDVGICNAGITNNSSVAWIELERVSVRNADNKDKEYPVNPIAKTAWQFIRMNMNYIVFPNSDFMSDPDNPTLTGPFFGALFGPLTEFLNTIRGFNGKMLTENYAQTTDPTKSVVRLYTPDGRKFGGGSRIYKLKFTDNWSAFDGANISSTYSTKYTYELEDGSSSGVASYEPIIGGEENPFKKPIHYTEKPSLIAIANQLYDLEPFCEFLYPAASVGYSRIVTEVELPQQVEGLEAYPITRHGNGYTVTEFYTAKEFPTKSSSTELQKISKGGLNDPNGLNHALASMFGASVNGITASQGFQIILNDMHGKLKRHLTINSETNENVSEVSYEYKVKNEFRTGTGSYSPGVGALELDNEVKVLNADGTFETKPIGVDIDAFVDLNENREITHVPGFDLNFHFDQAGVPLLFFIPLPKYRRVENYIVTASMTKVITQSGILTKVISKENGYALETENLAYDAKTGSVLLTRTKNAFNDNIYSMSYPAHWAYDGMGQAYQNIGFEFDFEIIDGLGYASENQGQYLAKGDEIIIPNNAKRYWIFHIEKIDVNGTPMYEFGLIDAAGNIKYNGTYNGKVIRSGRRNMQGLGIGQTVSLSDPLHYNQPNQVEGTFGSETEFSDVIASSAIEYDENWQTFRGFYRFSFTCDESTPFVYSESDCSGGKGFARNRHRMRTNFVSNMCNAADPNNGAYGDPQKICELIECPPKRFKKDNNGEEKKIPDKNDPNFDKSKTRPSTFGSYLTQTTGYYDYNELVKSNNGGNKNSYFGNLTASIDNLSFSPQLAFPDCSTLITHMSFKKFTGTNLNAGDPPCGVFKYYSSGPNLFCWEMYTFQYESDVAILEDDFQMSGMYLDLKETTVDPGTGLDVNYYEVHFVMYPDIQAYMWSSCPTCPQVNYLDDGNSGQPAGSGVGSGPVDPETPPAGNTQGTLPGGENPYILGVYGNWRPKKSYIYYDTRNTYNQRVQSEDVPGDFNSTNIRKDGVLQDYKIFWNPPSSSTYWTKSSTVGNQSDPWKWNSNSDQYHPNGYEIQTHDVLDIYNSAYFSPVNHQPYFVVNNASLRNSLGENFEDYWEYCLDVNCTPENTFLYLNKYNIDNSLIDNMKRTSFQWNLWASFNPYAYVQSGVAHTGKNSLFLTQTPHSGTENWELNNQTPGEINIVVYPQDQFTGQDHTIFKVGNEDLIDRFSPENNEYIVSFWVKKVNDASTIELKVVDATVNEVLPLMPNSIEGWIKKTYKVVYNSSPNGQTQIALATNDEVYIDDLRMQPANSTMKTYTYDPQFLRLSSTSDENNYATFYEYDIEGNLIRVKRETERGIFTISENGKNIRH